MVSGKKTFFESRLRPVALIVDPDRTTAKEIGGVLEKAGFLPLLSTTGAQALRIARKAAPSVVVVNADLPDFRGARFVRILRRLPTMKKASIVVLSVPSAEGLEIECLKNGADDFLVWGVNDLSAIPLRLSRALLALKTDGAAIERGAVRVDVDSREVFISGSRLPNLRPREFDLLAYLMRRSPAVATWMEIQRDVWRTPEHALDHGHETKTIAVHCDRLRRKIGGNAIIAVRRGIGLQFMAEEKPHFGGQRGRRRPPPRTP